MASSEGIFYFTEDSKYQLKNKIVLRSWISACLDKQGLSFRTINFIFCSDQYLHKLNVKYLNHDTLTDVITFDYSEENDVCGDVFISVDRVKENAKGLGIKMETELYRVMIHGVLHLCGYKDKSKREKKEMTEAENQCLATLNIG